MLKPVNCLLFFVVGIDLQQSFTPQYSGYMKTQSTQVSVISPYLQRHSV